MEGADIMKGFDEIQQKLDEVKNLVALQKGSITRIENTDKFRLTAKFESLVPEYLASVGDVETLQINDVLLEKHMFERLAAKKNAEKKANELMAPVYARERYFFSRHSCPEGKLTPQQLEEVSGFWAPYSFAYKNNPETQRVFSIVSGKFDPSYISFGLHYHYLKKFWNTHKVTFMSDKNDIGILFPDVKAPKTIFHLIGGAYYDESRNVITRDDAVAKCLAEIYEKGNDLVLKPSREGEGRGIVFLRKEIPCEDNEKILNKIAEDRDYICQRAVRNHESWSSYPGCNALNVARINTMNFNGKPKIMSSYMKIAVKGMDIVNVALGALCLRIMDDGCFDKRGLDFYAGVWYDKLPNGEEFAGRKLHNYDKVKETVLMMANRVPELKAIAWDITVDEDGDVLIIELNPSGGAEGPQLLGMHPYGGKEKMKEILDEYLIKRFYYERSDWEWDYWEFKNTISIHKYEGLKKVVQIPERLRGKEVTAIHSRAFVGKNLKKIVVPDSVNVLRGEAFTGCGRDCEIVLPQSQAPSAL